MVFHRYTVHREGTQTASEPVPVPVPTYITIKKHDTNDTITNFLIWLLLSFSRLPGVSFHYPIYSTTFEIVIDRVPELCPLDPVDTVHLNSDPNTDPKLVRYRTGTVPGTGTIFLCRYGFR